MQRTASLLTVACLLGTALGAPPLPAEPNIVQLASSVPDLSTLVTAIKAAGAPRTAAGSDHRFKPGCSWSAGAD